MKYSEFDDGSLTTITQHFWPRKSKAVVKSRGRLRLLRLSARTVGNSTFVGGTKVEMCVNK